MRRKRGARVVGACGGATIRLSRNADPRAARLMIRPLCSGTIRVAVLACLLSIAGLSLADPSPSPSEYEIKAAFLYNFTKFVEWPPAVLPDASTAVVIGVLGDDPFSHALDETVADRSANGHPLVIRRLSDASDAKGCQIVFVSASEGGHIAGVVSSLAHHSVLTVSDVDSFAERGGMIQFVMQDNKVRLLINLDAAERTGLKISSQLLKLAQIVSDHASAAKD